jgi:hypothetical protein
MQCLIKIMDSFTFTSYTNRGLRKEEGQLHGLKETDLTERKGRTSDERREERNNTKKKQREGEKRENKRTARGNILVSSHS